jgi:hypothetical protein
LIFGEVSRQWRDIAFSTPRLWNCISLKCTNANMETNISLCNTWLKRSSALPLSIRFYRVPSSDAVPREVLDHYQNLLWTILPYAGRWRLLDLKDLAACSYHVLHALLPNSVPMLETLSVSHDVPPTFAHSALGMDYARRRSYTGYISTPSVEPPSWSAENGRHSRGRS